MIIKLTLDEARKYVARAFDIPPSTFDLEIVSPDRDVRDCLLLVAFRIAIKEFPLHAFDEKIKCIKRFRDLVPRGEDGYPCVGLADAKWAVENPTVTLVNLERTGRIQG